jgi:xanthine dehydrogenase YagR molybdenum-binding subunit
VPPALAAVAKLKAEIERHAKRVPTPGSNAPWREAIASSPDLRVSAVRAKDAAPTARGITSPLKSAGVMGRVFGWMLRRQSNIAVGAGVPSSVQVVEVEVDTWLGHIRVLNVHAGIAVGRLVAPDLARNQAVGSIVQGIGYALYEARELDAHGEVLSASLEDYRIPGIADTPEIDVHFDEA